MFPFLICIKKLIINHFSFSDVEHVEEIRQRLRIIGAGTASYDKRIIQSTITAVKRDPGKIQHL